MKIQKAGYIKLHRKFLKSQVRKLNSATVCMFIDLLLLADIEGKIETSYREIQEVLRIGSRHTIIKGLEQLKKADAIDYKTNPNLLIKLNNWGVYQARSTGAQNAPQVVQKMHQSGAQNAPLENAHNKVPVQLTKEYKNIFKNSETAKKQNSKILNFLEPQTDLEKLIRFYLQLTNHPALNKPNANDLLNVALKNDIPNFEMVLANCTNVTQAAKCVREFVQSAEGTYNLFYLPRQIDSIRQKVEERERREMIERRRKEDERREYMRILAEKEQWASEHGDDAGC